jgi:hypothetical protein
VNAGATTADANPKSGRSGERGRGGRKKYVLHLDKFQSSSVFLSVTHQPYSCFRAKVPTEQSVPVPVPLPPIDLELPVDPNEPTYCLCNQVSYGEMVACDNPNVCDMPFVYSSFDEFHFSCPCFGVYHFRIHLAVQNRVVSLWLCGRQGATQGKVVLPKLHRIPEEAKRQVICSPQAAVLVCPCLLIVLLMLGNKCSSSCCL